MNHHYLGIDPGKTGALALLDGSGCFLTYLKTPVLGKEYDEQAMVAFLKRTVVLPRLSPAVAAPSTFQIRAVIEKASAFPGQGVTGMFNFGVGWGLWKGMMAALEISYEIVLPRQWQAIVPGLKGLETPARKKAVIAWARRLWPTIPNHSGVCEAAAMAEWLRRRENA